MWVHCLHALWVPTSKLHAMPHIKYDLMSSNICSISFFNGSCFPSKSYHFIIQCRGPPRFKSELCLLNSFNVKRNRSTSFTMNSVFLYFVRFYCLSIINVQCAWTKVLCCLWPFFYYEYSWWRACSYLYLNCFK